MVENAILECPFCKSKSIKAVFTPAFFQAHTSRSSAKGSVTKFFKTKEKYEVQSSCPNCGKSAKEIQKVLNEGKKDPEKEKKILERLKEQGMNLNLNSIWSLTSG